MAKSSRSTALAAGVVAVAGVAVCYWVAVKLRRRRCLQAALDTIDAAHSCDPAKDAATGQPAELVYAASMTRWMRRLTPRPSEALQIACRAQHLERWLHPRDAFPKNREGYFQWRTEAKKAHTARAAQILRDAGLADLTERVAYIMMKKGLGEDADSQAMEDAACLVFLEDHAQRFVSSYEGGLEKLVGIFKKTWVKMSEEGRRLALTLDLAPDVAAVVADALRNA